jgi:hypothetical protein
MESYLVLADSFSKTSLHKVAYSALPNAPVQPYVEPRRVLRRLIAALRPTVRPPAIDMKPARYSPGC